MEFLLQKKVSMVCVNLIDSLLEVDPKKRVNAE